MARKRLGSAAQSHSHTSATAAGDAPRALPAMETPPAGEDADADADALAETAALLAARTLELAQLQRTHDEYVKSSCEYERELELELDRHEKQTQALAQAAESAERERLAALARLEAATAELAAAREAQTALAARAQDMKWRIQRLEQANDELETAARVACASVGSLEHKADELLEQTVFLQHEKEELQRELAAVTVAEVHPAPPALLAPLATAASPRGARSPSLRFSRRPSGHVVIEVAAEARKARGKGGYPDVVESCLHLTCRHCHAQQQQPQRQWRQQRPARAVREANRPLGFFERLRAALFGPDELDAV